MSPQKKYNPQSHSLSLAWVYDFGRRTQISAAKIFDQWRGKGVKVLRLSLSLSTLPLHLLLPASRQVTLPLSHAL